jgi:hypothetical protein
VLLPESDHPPHSPDESSDLAATTARTDIRSIVTDVPPQTLFAFNSNGDLAVILCPESGAGMTVNVYEWNAPTNATPSEIFQVDGVHKVVDIGFDSSHRLYVLSALAGSAKRAVSWWDTTTRPVNRLGVVGVPDDRQLGACFAVHDDGRVAVALERGPPGPGSIYLLPPPPPACVIERQ